MGLDVIPQVPPFPAGSPLLFAEDREQKEPAGTGKPDKLRRQSNKELEDTRTAHRPWTEADGVRHSEPRHPRGRREVPVAAARRLVFEKDGEEPANLTASLLLLRSEWMI